MSDVMELLRKRQGDASNEAYANQIGLTGSTLWRYHNGKSEIDIESRGKLLQFYAARGDVEMVGALLAYKATDAKLNALQLRQLGDCFLEITPQKLALASST